MAARGNQTPGIDSAKADDNKADDNVSGNADQGTTGETPKQASATISGTQPTDVSDVNEKDDPDQTYIVHRETYFDNNGVMHTKDNRIKSEDYPEQARKNGW